MNLKVLVIAGPTAVGKTELSIKLAKKYNGEIINADSMQIYKSLDIGTNKISLEERRGIPHHLIDILNPTDNFSAGNFSKMAQILIQQINDRGHLPIMVGGSNFFIQTAIGDRRLGEVGPTDRREEIYQKNHDDLIAGFQNFGRELDTVPDIQNDRRLMRIYERVAAGDLTMNQKPDINNRLFDVLIFGLDTERELLHQRINKRVDQMILSGLEEEARMLYELGGVKLQSGQAIGYKEWFDYFENKKSFKQVAEEIKTDTRRLAKKQLTFIRNQFNDTHWFNLIEKPESIQTISELIDKWLRTNV